MSTKNSNKKKTSLFDSKNMIVLGIAAAVVALFAVIMTLFMPNEVAENAETMVNSQSAATSKENVADSGLNSVYDEKAVATTGRANKTTEDAEKDEEKKAEEDKSSERDNVSEAHNENMGSMFDFPLSGAVVKDYSGDELVYSETMEDWRTHNGIDFFAEEGSEVRAVADGTVEAVTENGMLGRTVILLHSGGVRSIYSNLADGNEIAVGDNVLKGTVIAHVGSSAAAEALEKPHLHFEVSLNEETANPYDYLPQPKEEAGE